MNILLKENYLGLQGVQDWLWAVPGSTWGLVGVYSESTWGLLGVFPEESHFLKKCLSLQLEHVFWDQGLPPSCPEAPRSERECLKDMCIYIYIHVHMYIYIYMYMYMRGVTYSPCIG